MLKIQIENVAFYYLIWVLSKLMVSTTICKKCYSCHEAFSFIFVEENAVSL